MLNYEKETLNEIRDSKDINTQVLTKLICKFGSQRDFLQRRVEFLETPESGQGLRCGSTVTIQDGLVQETLTSDHRFSTATVINVKRNIYGGDIERLTLRTDKGRIITIPGVEEAEDNLIVDDLVDITPKVYLNVYLYDRAYGGPEEGGWWYDTYEPIEDRCRIVTEEQGPNSLERLREELDKENESRIGPSSVRSEGYYIAVLESWPAEYEPRHRPHYC